MPFAFFFLTLADGFSALMGVSFDTMPPRRKWWWWWWLR
jgi:hypothetical protein